MKLSQRSVSLGLDVIGSDGDNFSVGVVGIGLGYCLVAQESERPATNDLIRRLHTRADAAPQACRGCSVWAVDRAKRPELTKKPSAFVSFRIRNAGHVLANYSLFVFRSSWFRRCSMFWSLSKMSAWT